MLLSSGRQLPAVVIPTGYVCPVPRDDDNRNSGPQGAELRKLSQASQILAQSELASVVSHPLHSPPLLPLITDIHLPQSNGGRPRQDPGHM